MRLLFIDCDTLRPDHLGCYGYPRGTSPNIDSVAAEGICFDDYYCADAPCLPSRAALMTGRFGFHTGVVGHGGTAADMRLDGAARDMGGRCMHKNLPMLFRRHGMHTASISTFSERHGAWWFNAGFEEVINNGTLGFESAQSVTPKALDWLERNRDREDWFLHVHYWDPHTPHRAPDALGQPFENVPAPQMEWMTEERFARQKDVVGPHSASEQNMFDDAVKPGLRQLPRLDTRSDFKKNIDNYDTGIYWMDQNIGQILDLLKAQGIYEDTAIIVTADHGENQGELNVFNEHGTADAATTHIPLIVKWKGCARGARRSGFHYNLDLLPTLRDLLARTSEPKPSFMRDFFPEPDWSDIDGESFADCFFESGEDVPGRPYLVVSQCAHVCQRAVLFDRWEFIRTYHDGYHLFPEDMLFDLEADPHELEDVAQAHPEVCWRAVYLLDQWATQNMKKQVKTCQVDPLWTVMSEGGPFHARGQLRRYCQRLESTGRGWAVEELKRRHPDEFE